MLNKVQLIGNVGGDPETRTTANGNLVANFSLATNRKWKDGNGKTQERVEWHQIACWNRLGEIAEQYVTKGRQLYVEGRLETERVKRDGEIFYYTKVVCQNFQLLGGRPANAEAPAEETAPEETPAEEAPAAEPKPAPKRRKTKAKARAKAKAA